ncbi:copper chaperone PCu(A)C [Streptomyces sp. NPDC051104]|uniref:copper chaperone PCu(A)C n=1 Tax=Streptomyces sp. NPDC051104 TaxID=3155044 RepID=UPI003419993C
MTEPAVWRPSWRRLAEAFLAALAPVAACVLALGGLAAWTASGAAGSPARVEVTSGRVFLPYGDGEESAAFFRISNSGGAEDELTGVTSTAVDRAMLGRNTTTSGNAGYMRPVESAIVPAGGMLAMSPWGPGREGDRAWEVACRGPRSVRAALSAQRADQDLGGGGTPRHGLRPEAAETSRTRLFAENRRELIALPVRLLSQNGQEVGWTGWICGCARSLAGTVA